MTIQQIRRAPFQLAQPMPRMHGLLDVATIRTTGPWMTTEGATSVVPDLSLSWNCASGQTDFWRCDAVIQKTFEGPADVSGIVFLVYVGFDCKGPDVDDMAEQALRVFALRESQLVEQSFTAWFGGGNGNGYLPSPAPGTEALATLCDVETVMQSYAGTPTIHLGYCAALELAKDNALIMTMNGWTTITGSKVVIGAGYPQNMIGGTGEVTIARSPEVTVNTFDTDNNTKRVLAERLYLATGDCPAHPLGG